MLGIWPLNTVAPYIFFCFTVPIIESYVEQTIHLNRAQGARLASWSAMSVIALAVAARIPLYFWLRRSETGPEEEQVKIAHLHQKRQAQATMAIFYLASFLIGPTLCPSQSLPLQLALGGVMVLLCYLLSRYFRRTMLRRENSPSTLNC